VYPKEPVPYNLPLPFKILCAAPLKMKNLFLLIAKELIKQEAFRKLEYLLFL
jgi:hypothetical protein